MDIDECDALVIVVNLTLGLQLFISVPRIGKASGVMSQNIWGVKILLRSEATKPEGADRRSGVSPSHVRVFFFTFST